MCGRYAFSLTWRELRHLLAGVASPESPGFDPFARSEGREGLPNSLDVRPTEGVPVFLSDAGRRSLDVLHWGFLPPWSRSAGGRPKPVFNARADGVVSKRTFADPFKRRRCLVPADSFDEWPKEGPLAGERVRIAREDGEALVFGGLWDTFSVEGNDLRCVTIVTTEPNPLISGMQVHDRMPLILAPESLEGWLAGSDSEAESLLRPYEGEDLTVHPVAKKPAKDAGQGTLF